MEWHDCLSGLIGWGIFAGFIFLFLFRRPRVAGDRHPYEPNRITEVGRDYVVVEGGNSILTSLSCLPPGTRIERRLGTFGKWKVHIAPEWMPREIHVGDEFRFPTRPLPY